MLWTQKCCRKHTLITMVEHKLALQNGLYLCFFVWIMEILFCSISSTRTTFQFGYQYFGYSGYNAKFQNPSTAGTRISMEMQIGTLFVLCVELLQETWYVIFVFTLIYPKNTSWGRGGGGLSLLWIKVSSLRYIYVNVCRNLTLCIKKVLLQCFLN